MLPPNPMRPARTGGRFLALLALLGCMLALIFPHASVRAATLRTVDTYADTVDPNDARLSLREAIALSAAGDVINFAPSMNAPNASGTIVLSGGALVINRALSIRGPGARRLAISGNNTSRVFTITGPGPVLITDLTLTRGRAPQGPVLPTSAGNAYGGAIYNSSSLTLLACAITDSLAQGGGIRGEVGGGGYGGGIFNSGGLSIRNCLLAGNKARSGESGAVNNSSYGGGLYSNASFTLISTTFTNNSAQHNGGAIMAGGAGSRLVIACTLCYNNVPSAAESDTAGGIYSHSTGKVILRNTIVSQNFWAGTMRDVKGAFTSQGFNLIGSELTSSASGSPWQPTDLTGTPNAPLDTKMGSLVNNSGPINTIAPNPGSLALNRGDDSLVTASPFLTTDQRGLPRKASTHVDIGAYETDVPQTGINLVVNSLSDPGDGIAGVGECTLREALKASNLQADANTITFRPGLTGTLTLSSGSGPLDITSQVTVTGPGARLLAISADSRSRVLQVYGSGGATFSGLTFRDGFNQGLAHSGTGRSAAGGGISNAASLVLNACSLLNSRVIGGAGLIDGVSGGTGGDGSGGAILNLGALTLRNCTLSGNEARGGAGSATGINGAGLGGAIYNFGAATLTNCTLSGNQALGGSGGFFGNAVGGAIYNAGSVNSGTPTSTVFLLNCTVAGNQAVGGSSTGGGLFTQTRTATTGIWNYIRLRNTLLAQNTATVGPDFGGTAYSDGFNVVGKTTGSNGWLLADRTGTTSAPQNPQIGALANNGGPTNTVALLTGSPAINNALINSAPTSDQRGASRSGRPDIGAFEFGGQVP